MRDTYASESLVQLAKSLGYDYEPAEIINDRREYTLSSIQKWFREVRKLNVWCFLLESDMWSYQIEDIDTVHDMSFEEKQYDEALEEGLRKACMLLIEKEYANKVGSS